MIFKRWPRHAHRAPDRNSTLCRELYEGYTRNAEIRKIDYRFVNNVGDTLIWADGEALEKIILNLLSNAFKYTPAGRSITVTLRDQEYEVAIEVSDTGSGISRDKQQRLFRRFESFNEDKSNPSTGIGLSIVKELADKHRARIQVESELDKGSSFTLFLKKGIVHFGPEVTIITGDDQGSRQRSHEVPEAIEPVLPAMR